MSSNIATNGTFEVSLRRAAIIAGCSLILMAIAAGFSFSYVLTNLVVPGDAATTANKIRASEALFRAGILGFLLVLVCDLLVSWALYIFLAPVNKSLSLLAALFRLAYTAVFGTALFNLVLAVRVIHGTEFIAAGMTEQAVAAQVILFLKAFSDIFAMGLVVFGCHLLVLGYVAFISGSIPKALGVLLLFAGLCYMGSNTAHILLPNYDNYKATVDMILGLPMAVGELAFAVWLLVKGGKNH